ncbi:hypothetical protein CAEBREN_04105 [Caenorhabditis brenneri]|uniref:Uncharacterized protein n=1 Tax=Caenorhabditis brenneri TaxID=135651 RepID=G0NTZ8_CAEBE|nr:hypothetical protein CAEBREN_04105 [Caenorhabditis brenneri]
MKSAFLLFFVLLAFCGGMYSHKSTLGNQMESLELKKFITKMQTFNVEAQQWTPNLQGACSAEMEEEFVFYLKWTLVTFFILGFLNCAYLVLKDIHHTYTVYREAELAHIEEQRRRIMDLKRRFNELVRNERIPGGRPDQERLPVE